MNVVIYDVLFVGDTLLIILNILVLFNQLKKV